MNRALLLPTLILLITIFSCSQDQGDNGSIFIDNPTQLNSMTPFLFKDHNNVVHMSWLHTKDQETTLFYSKLESNQWTEPEIVATGKDWFVNWADFPSLAVNSSGDILTYFLQMSDTGAYTYDIKMLSKKPASERWSDVFTLHDDNVKAEHGFVSIAPMNDDNFMVSWLDGRNTADTTATMETRAMTLRTAIISPNGEKIEEWELDDRVCDCCQTSILSSDSIQMVAFRDRSQEEVRDISISRFANQKWTSPFRVHADEWEIMGCPVNGPSIDNLGNNVAVAWFTGANDESAVKIAFSNDQGKSFESPMKLDLGSPIGRVKVKYIDSNQVVVVWMEKGDIVGAVVDQNEGIVKRYMYAKSSESRSSGFPQIVIVEERILLAWTDDADKSIKTSWFNI